MSVMGILLLITLLMALFLVTPSKANLSNQAAIKELETDLANAMNEEKTLQARAMSLRSTLLQLRDRPDTNRITSELSRIREGIIAKSNSLEEVNQQIADLKASRAEQVVKLGLNYLMQETEQIEEQAKQAAAAIWARCWLPRESFSMGSSRRSVSSRRSMSSSARTAASRLARRATSL